MVDTSLQMPLHLKKPTTSRRRSAENTRKFVGISSGYFDRDVVYWLRKLIASSSLVLIWKAYIQTKILLTVVEVYAYAFDMNCYIDSVLCVVFLSFRSRSDKDVVVALILMLYLFFS